MKRAILDVSSIIWTSLLASKDVEFGRKVEFEGKEVLINSAGYGYSNAMNHILKVMEDLSLVPRQLIFVMEGKNSKQDRQTLHPGYKAGRGKPPEQYEAFNECKERLIETFLGVGAQMCWQDGGVEADDVIAYLAKNLRGERWIVSGDKDLAAMVDPANGINHYRAGVHNANPFGEFPHRLIPVYIALVGDAGDKIPGAKGFGDKAFQLMHLAFGDDGLELMEDLIKRKELIKLEEDVGTLRELQKVIDDADGVYLSYELGRLRIERVNTLRRPLEWRVGMVKPRDQCVEQTLRKWAGVSRIVSAENYDEAMAWAKKQIDLSPEVSLDVETSTPPESDEWMESREKVDKLDVFGSELTSLQMTFGPNCQYTFYLPFDNVEEQDCTNLTMKQIADFVDLVPRQKVMFIQNVAFELPVCYMSWGEMWKDDPLYHGFLRNVRDTAIMSSYVDENRPKGLKDNSKLLLGYDQITYEQVTTHDELKNEWDGVGKIKQTYLEPILEDTGEMETVATGVMIPTGEMLPDGREATKPETKLIPKLKHVGDVEHVVVERKMNQLRASEVVAYGCDDTICTIALANHYRVIMEIEGTWDAFEAVETYPAYLTALAYVQGTAFSLESMAEQEKDDDVEFDKAKPILNDYLMKIGFEGTRFEPLIELDAAGIKRACLVITGRDLVDEAGKPTKVRTPAKLAKLIEFMEPESILPQLINDNAVTTINGIMESKFSGEPQLDLASPTQMKKLLYGHMNIPVRIINDVTDIEKAKQPDLMSAVQKFKQLRAGKSQGSMSDGEKELIKKKAKADDTAIETALAFDLDLLDDGAAEALKAIGTMKKVMTRRSLFYATYWKVLHWKDQKIHSSMNQCAAVTRRYSSSDPNLTQLPKREEGIRFREHFVPHHKDALIASEDFGSQELRLAAHESQDKNLLACYVGDNLRDLHSTTASGAMKMKWGAAAVKELFDEHGKDLDQSNVYDLFVRLRKLPKGEPVQKKAEDLRKDSKNVVFASFYGGQAVKISETLVMPLTEAQLILDAKRAMFPGIDTAAERAEKDCKRLGYATTMLGARRHLREGIASDDNFLVSRAARQAWNMRIQGSAAEMTKLAMGRLWKSGAMFKYDVRFIAPIHDELVVSVHRDHAVAYLGVQHSCMTEKYADMSVPIIGSISIGRDFAHQVECGDDYYPDRIQQAINDILAIREAA